MQRFAGMKLEGEGCYRLSRAGALLGGMGLEER